MRKVFRIIFLPVVLLFKHLYLSLNWILDNTIGYIFTKEYRNYNKTYNEKHNNWIISKRIISTILVLVLIFSFEVIYQNTLGVIIAEIFRLIGRFLELSIFGNTFVKVSRILIEFNQAYANGVGTTLYLSLIGTTVGLMIAVVFSYIVVMKINKNSNNFIKGIQKILKKFVNLYVTIIRGTPMMVQAMLIYWGTITVIPWDYKIAGLVVVSLNTTAYLTEVLRAGYESIDKGQTEGALSLGLSNIQTMFYVVFPQALKNSMASIGNEFVINIKDTAVLSVILVVDIFRISEVVAGRYFDYFTPFIIAALIYLSLTLSISKLLRHLEKKLELPETNLPSSN
ncbi:MAG TPA: amino acid ABC transporter permease [Acholeplasmataceae bacterium]|nr:amino acid ABC transporter permease [Acholeplasmataceae bacterium]